MTERSNFSATDGVRLARKSFYDPKGIKDVGPKAVIPRKQKAKQ